MFLPEKSSVMCVFPSELSYGLAPRQERCVTVFGTVVKYIWTIWIDFQMVWNKTAPKCLIFVERKTLDHSKASRIVSRLFDSSTAAVDNRFKICALERAARTPSLLLQVVT